MCVCVSVRPPLFPPLQSAASGCRPNTLSIAKDIRDSALGAALSTLRKEHEFLTSIKFYPPPVVASDYPGYNYETAERELIEALSGTPVSRCVCTLSVCVSVLLFRRAYS